MRLTMRVLKFGAALTALTAAMWWAPGSVSRGHDQSGTGHESLAPASPPANLPAASVYQLEGSWTDTEGAPVPLSTLRGQPQVVAMFYASCTSVCPLIVDEMLKIERELPPGIVGRVSFALFSFDPDRDIPAALKAYAIKRGLLRPHWRLLTGTRDEVQELAAVLGMRIRKEPNGDFSHSTLITTLDAEGMIHAQLAGLNRDHLAFLRALVTAARP